MNNQQKLIAGIVAVILAILFGGWLVRVVLVALGLAVKIIIFIVAVIIATWLLRKLADFIMKG